VALDLGGTNFRVLLVELKAGREEKPNVSSKVFLIPLRIMLGTAQMVSSKPQNFSLAQILPSIDIGHPFPTDFTDT